MIVVDMFQKRHMVESVTSAIRRDSYCRLLPNCFEIDNGQRYGWCNVNAIAPCPSFRFGAWILWTELEAVTLLSAQYRTGGDGVWLFPSDWFCKCVTIKDNPKLYAMIARNIIEKCRDRELESLSEYCGVCA